MHKLLERQLRRCLGSSSTEGLPENLKQLFDKIDKAYVQADEDRLLTERALEITSTELTEQNRELQRLAAFPEKHPNPILEINADKEIVYVNPAGLALFPTILKEGIHHPLLESSPIHAVITAEDKDSYASAVYDMVLKGRVYALDFIYLADIKKTHIYVRDVTVQNKTQLELQVAHEELKQSHKELVQAQMQVIQAAKLESLGRLAAGVAHEVKNPLAILRLGIDFIMNNIVSDDEDLELVLVDMKEAILRADKVIFGLLDFSAHRDLKSEPLQINQLLEESIHFVKHEFQKAKIMLGCDFTVGLPDLMLDDQKIQQVFVNLFINSVHAMGEGGQLKVLSYIKDTQTLDAQEPKVGGDKCVIVEVNDTGPGFESVDRVFDPFYTTKPHGEGTGLGMSTVKKILELHGAHIHIRNLSTEGAQVKIYFPIPGSQADN